MLIHRYFVKVPTVRLNLNFIHTRVLARLTRAKLKKLACDARTVACDFGVRACEIANTRDTRELHVTSSHLVCHITRACGVTTGTV